MSKFENIPESVWEMCVKARLVVETYDTAKQEQEFSRFVTSVPQEVSEVVMCILSLTKVQRTIARHRSAFGVMSKEYYELNDSDIDRRLDHLITELSCRLSALLQELERRQEVVRM